MAVFPEQNPKSRPVANWMAILTALTTNMPATNVTIIDLNESIIDGYRLLWITYALNTQADQQVTNVQAAAVLAAFNTAYGTVAANLPAAINLVRSAMITKWQANLLKTANSAFIAALSV